MPEGPEIRLAADRLAGVLVGNEIVEAYFSMPALRRFRRRVAGAKVTAVDTRGKAMLVRFDNGLTLYAHNQLYGRWYVTPRDRPPDTRRSLRVALHTDSHSAWLYSASDIEVLTAPQLARHPFLARIGPDVLDPALTPAALAERLNDQRFARRALGGLYLDQSYLAGIGNYLRSEILFSAALNPALRPIDLSHRDGLRLARETLRVSRRSYRTRGVTLTSDLARRLRRAGWSRSQYRFWVFGRAGLPCHRCGETIERIPVASRGLFLCPECQALPGTWSPR